MIQENSTKIHFFLFLIVTAVFIWSVIKPVTYWNWAMEVSPAVAGMILLIVTYNKFRFTTLSYFICAILAVLIFIGGHYIYSKVPLFNWLKDVLELNRNHYDRFGHFMKGLFAIVIREILLRNTQLTKGPWLFAIAAGMTLALASLYEIIEWLVSMVSHGGQAAKNFLGIQGDIWDTQWDMLFTLIGSILALLALSKLHNRLVKRIAE